MNEDLSPINWNKEESKEEFEKLKRDVKKNTRWRIITQIISGLGLLIGLYYIICSVYLFFKHL